MSEKNSKSIESKENEAVGNKKRLGKKGIIIIIVASVLAVAITAGIIVAVVLKNRKDKDDASGDGIVLDILNDDLSEYVEIDEKYYKGYTVEVDYTRIPVLVENEIIKKLCLHKDEEAITDGDGIISVGDVVYIFYKGYYLNGEEKVYFDGGSNIGGSAYELEIGSGGFIPGFEYNMIGKNPADYNEDNPMIIETYFPEKYPQSSELAGKTAWFEVTVEIENGKYNIEEYNAPALTDSFITETLMISSSVLEEYEGETLVDKYRAKLRKECLESIDVDALKENAFWISVMNGGVVKKYPEAELEAAYEAQIEEIENYYENSYYSFYYTLEEFGCLYLGVDYDKDWKTEARNYVKENMKKQLLFYHIMNVEGLKPTEEEYNQLFDEYLSEALEQEHIIPERYSTTEEYEAAKEEYKSKIIEKNGEDYFKVMIYYQLGIEAVLEYANVVEITE